MTTISYFSDLHTELQQLPAGLNKIPGGDIAVLCGDITSAGRVRTLSNDADARGAKARLSQFLEILESKYQYVLWVMGNHEFYGSSLQDARSELATYLIDRNFDRTFILQRDRFDFGSVAFLGCTLWTNFFNRDPHAMLRAQFKMSDYKFIRNREGDPLNPQDTVYEHEGDLLWLRSELQRVEAEGLDAVVLTHHAPSLKAEYGAAQSELSAAFCSSLDEKFHPDIHPNIRAWIYGHTHNQIRFDMNHIPCYTNMYGYKGYESCPASFDPTARLDLDAS